MCFTNTLSKKLFFIVNPHSGTMKAGSQLLKIIETLTDDGYRVTVHPTRCRGDATEIIKNLETDYDTVVCCGGDGTLNEVITGMMQSGKRFKLGYIPAGTQNEWSSGLKIPRNLTKAAKVVTEGRVVSLDIGSFNDKYFSYTASFGAFTEASYSTPQQFKNVLGQAAYILEGIRLIGSIKPLHLKVEHDGGVTEGDFLFGAVSNSLSVGGVIKLKDSIVNLSDGMFEVLLIRNPKNAIEFQSLVGSVIAQKVDNPNMVFLHTSSLKIASEDEFNWTLDGEMAAGSETVTIKNLHNAMDFYVPNEEIKVLS